MYQFDSLFAALSGLGIANGILFGLYLLRKGQTQTTNQYLGYFMLLLSLRFAITTLSYFYRSPEWYVVDVGLVINLALGPCFLAYVCSIFRAPLAASFWIKQLLPAVFLGVLALLARTVFPLGTFFEPFKNGWFLVNQLTLLHWILYLVYAYRWSKLRLAEKKAQGWNVQKMQEWLWGLLLFMGILILGYSFNNAKVLCVIFCPLFYTIIVYLILAYFIKNYTSLQKTQVWEKSKSLAIKTEQIPQLKAQLQRLMEEEQGFRDPELGLDKLAQQVGSSSHALSHYINTYEGCNFPDWLNRFRVEYACQLLLDPQYAQLKIAALAYESGFNTLSVFNGAFKKVVGCTPSEFRKQMLKC
jgi:AraC-like DNA-binding protein